MRTIASRLREQLAEVPEFAAWHVVAEGEDLRGDLPGDAPLCLVQAVRVAPAISAAPQHPAQRVAGELLVTVAAAHPETAPVVMVTRLGQLRAGMWCVCRDLRGVEYETGAGVGYSISAYVEDWQPLAAEGAAFSWRLPFVWVRIGGGTAGNR